MINLAQTTEIRRALFLGLVTFAIVALLISSSSTVLLADEKPTPAKLELKRGADNRKVIDEIKIRCDDLIFDGKDKEAIEAGESLVKSCKEIYSAESRELLEAKLKLGDVYINGKKEIEGASLLDECYKFATKFFPEKDSLRTQAKSLYGQSLLSRERSDEALPILEEVYQTYRDTHGELNILTLDATEQVATAHSQLKRWDHAISLLSHVAKYKRDTLGPDHHSTINAFERLYLALFETKPDAAVTLIRSLYKIESEKLGVDHNKTQKSLRFLSLALLKTNRVDEALQIHQDEVQRCKEKYGATNIKTISSIFNLFGSLMATGKKDDAASLALKTYTAAKEKLGPEAEETLKAQRMHVAVIMMNELMAEKQVKVDTLFLIKSGYEISEAKLGKEDDLTNDYRADLAFAYAFNGQLETALLLYKENYTYQEKLVKRKDALNGMNNYAMLLAKLNRFNEAVPIFEEIYKVNVAQFGTKDVRTLKVMHNLAYFYNEIGRTEESIDLSRKAIDLRAKSVGRNAPDTCVSMINLGRVLVQHDRDLAEAEKMLLDGYNGIYAASNDPKKDVDPKKLTEARESLVKLYELQKKPDEVAKWREAVKR